MKRYWPSVRKFLVFQLKLYIDAFRDIFLSALSLLAFVLDIILLNQGPDSYFEKVLAFGRRSEFTINLFNQYDLDQQGGTSVDKILKDMESSFEKKRKKQK
ncbi:MAG TPA: hypothetical protein DCL66_01330 [Gammaproteobacteria bacterium]|nr:hypothetical protein [Gammaproteobacteria bacterium]|tara:strand:+ start:884 stop:1186 length:303 start_codon:yes stop_codon:yes gene_type:complete